MGLVQIHVTFCENVVFQEFKRILHITLAKYLGQESIAGSFGSRPLQIAFSSIEYISWSVIVRVCKTNGIHSAESEQREKNNGWLAAIFLTSLILWLAGAGRTQTQHIPKHWLRSHYEKHWPLVTIWLAIKHFTVLGRIFVCMYIYIYIVSVVGLLVILSLSNMLNIIVKIICLIYHHSVYRR